MIAASLLLASCANGTPGDHPVSVALTNGGDEPLRCRLMFGHWVERDLGMLMAGASTRIDATQAADGALYILRADGARKMMIETLACGREGDWVATRGQVDLAPIRAARAKSVTARCGLQSDARQTRCAVERIES